MDNDMGVDQKIDSQSDHLHYIYPTYTQWNQSRVQHANQIQNQKRSPQKSFSNFDEKQTNWEESLRHETRLKSPRFEQNQKNRDNFQQQSPNYMKPTQRFIAQKDIVQGTQVQNPHKNKLVQKIQDEISQIELQLGHKQCHNYDATLKAQTLSSPAVAIEDTHNQISIVEDLDSHEGYRMKLMKAQNQIQKLKTHIDELEKENMANKFQVINLEIELKKTLSNKKLDNSLLLPNQSFLQLNNLDNQDTSVRQNSNKRTEIEERDLQILQLQTLVKNLQKQLKSDTTNSQSSSNDDINHIPEKSKQSQPKNTLPSEFISASCYDEKISLQMKEIENLKENEKRSLSKIENYENIIQTRQRDFDINTKFSLGEPKNEFITMQKEIQAFQDQIENLKKENEKLNNIIEISRDSSLLELQISKNILKLSEQRQKELEDQIFIIQDQLMEVKQKLADTLNTVLEFGEGQLMERIQSAIAYCNIQQ